MLHRNWQKNKYRNDAAYREKCKKRKREWRHAKIERCPAYRELGLLRSRHGWLREKIAAAAERLRADERELMRVGARIVKLAAECKGK